MSAGQPLCTWSPVLGQSLLRGERSWPTFVEWVCGDISIPQSHVGQHELDPLVLQGDHVGFSPRRSSCPPSFHLQVECETDPSA